MSRMNRTLLSLGVSLLTIVIVTAQEGSDAKTYPFSDLDLSAESDPRFFLVNTNSTSVTIGYNSFALGVAGVLGLLGLLALALFYAAGATGDDYTGYEDYSTGYARSASFDPTSIDWEKFSILDWISIGEETWNKFDPSDLDCQKRLICEVHQNTSNFGSAASRMVDIFSYLQYAEVLSLPDELKALVEDYLDAADRGRSMQKDCGEVFNSCDFSVKKMVDKFSHNEI